MSWMVLLIGAVLFHSVAFFSSSEGVYIEPFTRFKANSEDDANDDDQLDSLKMQRLTQYLAEILLQPGQTVPLLYVEDSPKASEYVDASRNDESDYRFPDYQNQIDSEIPIKRTRYYRKYPWKRQNSREAYDAENRYLCQPSRDDVFRLLVALHEARQGNRGHTVNFCNRKRPATAVFTNIRFLGKRK